jgi:ATP-binding protein involved in chromosome partitioning
MVAKADVLDALSKVKGPDLTGDLVSLGLVSDPVISGDSVMFAITVDAARAQELEPLRQAAEKAVSKVEGVNKVMAALTAEVKAGTRAPAAQPHPAHLPAAPRRQPVPTWQPRHRWPAAPAPRRRPHKPWPACRA